MIWALALALAVVAALPVMRERMRQDVRALRDTAPGELVPLSQGVTHCRWLGRTRGPVAVCIHGLTTPSTAWEGLARQLEETGFRVLVYDLYGRGLSDAPRVRHTPGFYVRQLQDVLDHYDLTEDLTLIGYSMGGVIATAAAVEEPGRYRQVALVAPAGLGMPFSRFQRFVIDWPWIGDWLFHMLWPGRHRAVIDRGQAPELVREAQRDALDRRGFVGAVLSSLRHSLSKPVPRLHRALAETGLPVLAVWGNVDPVIPLSGMGQLAQANREARQEVVAGADHGLPFTHPEELGLALARLMDEVRVRSSQQDA